MSNRFCLLLLTVVLAVCGAGCGRSGSTIKFDDLKYPVSMSGSLYGPHGEFVTYKKELDRIQDFRYTQSFCSLFYTWMPLTKSDDLIEQMNKKIEAVGGDGMANVSVKSDFSELTYVFPLNLLPIWPGCSDITVSGMIVKFEHH